MIHTMRQIFYFCLSGILLAGCSQAPPPEPYGAVPSERQRAWHETGFYAFVHFNMNTFTNKEWGYGDEKPIQFNPTHLDCRQWARICKEAGMQGIILTAKHHDGFCLWPSQYTRHSVKNSPWKNGKGDVVRELSEACRDYGLKMGIYLSPWDRNHPDYGKPEYLTYYRNQLRELLTNYGDIFEVWFDGANGGTGWYGGANENRKIDNRTYYDWENTWKIVRELQPDACIFSDGGPDVRWVGNEKGYAGETNWCTLNRKDFAPGVVSDRKFLQEGQEDGSHWVPAEVDVSIRPGWYYHPEEDNQVKSWETLLNIYYSSIGRNANLLLNFPVDPRGLIHEKDVEQVLKLAETVRADFSENLASEAKISASEVRGRGPDFGPANVLDRNNETYWATNDGQTTGSLTLNFRKPTTFNRFMVQEYIPLGQRVQAFTLEAFIEDKWKNIASETTIGTKRILRFPDITTTKVRFTITAAKACPVIQELGVFKAEPV
jgi:alpha-L-fucosidase